MADQPNKPKKGPGRKPGGSNKVFGLPVREAKDTLVIPLLQVDIDEAQKHKPTDVNDKANFLSCVIAQGATRVCGADRVAILRATAYVAFPGDRHTKRYIIDKRSRQVLEAWDRGEPILEGVELRLRAPSRRTTRAADRARRKVYRRQQPPGVGDRKRKTGRKQSPSDPLHNVVRNGNLVKLAS